MADKLSKEDIEFRSQIAQRLKEIRESTEKNQTEFGYDLGIDQQAVSRIEAGQGASIYVIRNYCRAAGITLKKFFDSPIFSN
jgi:transcriptional regulator with XRE-family HTH domain